MIPYYASKLVDLDKKYDLTANNICVVECGGKYNIHIFMRVLNNFEIPYVVLHDVDPINFPEDKPNKTDKEQQELRTFNENEFIRKTLNEAFGKIIKVNSEFENISGVSKTQVEKHGKVQAAYNKYEDLDVTDYPEQLKETLDLILEWTKPEPVYEIQG